MARRIKAFIMEASGNIAGKYGNGWMRLNRSGNYKDTINVLPEEVKLSELAKTDIKDVKLDILNDYFGRTVITPQGNLARIIIGSHEDALDATSKVKPKFLYSIDAATGKEVKDTENFKVGSGFTFVDDSETKISASFVEETTGEGKDKVTYHGFNRARYKNVKKQLYPTWECTTDKDKPSMYFIARDRNGEAYPDVVFYRVNNGQNKIGFVQLDGNTGTISPTYYWLDINPGDGFRVNDVNCVAIYQPEMAMIKSSDGELAKLNTSPTPVGDYIPAPNDALLELMYNDIITQHHLATRININEYTPIGGSNPTATINGGWIWWVSRIGTKLANQILANISACDYTPSKLGLKTAQEWDELDKANRLYDDTPIWLAELVIPLSNDLEKLQQLDDLGDRYENEKYYYLPNPDSKFLLRIPCKPVSGPISKDLDNYFGFVPINDQYLEISNGPHLWHGPLRTSAGDISRVGSEAKQLKGKVTFQNDALGFMGVIYRGLVNNSIDARKWLEWQVNLWLTTYALRRNHNFRGGISDVNCTLSTTDGITYTANITYAVQYSTRTKVISNFINLNAIKVIYHKDMAAYRDNVFKQRDAFINTVNLNNVNEVARSIPYLGGLQLSNDGNVPNQEYWMKYIIPRLKYSELYMRVAVMTDGENLRPTYAYQDIQLHGFLHTGLSFMNKVPENNPDNRKSDAIYAMFGVNGVPSQRTEYLHVSTPNYLTGNRGFYNVPLGHFRLPANLNANSIVSRYNFYARNPNATYLTQGDGWGFTGNADKNNWHRGNLHSLVNFEPAPAARLFKDKPIYTMIPWENGQVDYQYIRGYLHGTIQDNMAWLHQYESNKLFVSRNSPARVVLGGYFPCLSGFYFNLQYNYRRDAPPPLRHGILGSCDIAPLVRVASVSPLLPHEWKPYEGNVNELIDGVSSTMIENPLYDYTDGEAWYRKAFDQYTLVGERDRELPYKFNTKGHPISTYDYHLDAIEIADGPKGLINQFRLPNQNRQESIYAGKSNNNPRYRSILYTRKRAVKLGIGETYGTSIDPNDVSELAGVNDYIEVHNSPQSWLITAGLDILIEHAKRVKGTPKDLKPAFAKIFAKHGIPDSKWLPDWEQGPEVFFLQNDIWLEYFFASAKLIRGNLRYEENKWSSLVTGYYVERGVNIEDSPTGMYKTEIVQL
mgnify:CR=1 FL=1